MKALAVSGSEAYKSLCPAARNEEKRLRELRKRHESTVREVQNFSLKRRFPNWATMVIASL
jgi:hypothetical protein